MRTFLKAETKDMFTYLYNRNQPKNQSVSTQYCKIVARGECSHTREFNSSVFIVVC